MKRWIKIGICILLMVVCGVSGYIYYLYKSVEKTAEQMYVPLDPQKMISNKLTPTAHELPETKQLEPFTVLLLGVDERKNDVGRSDAIIVMAVNPSKGSVLMFNIPRDSRTEIIGHNTVDKINHAYAFGGTEMSVQTVEHFLDFPIDYYVKVNMEGIVNIINIWGKITVNNQMAFDYEGYHFGKGILQLDGDKALAYSRMRYDDPRGDLGRNERQRQIIESLEDRGLSISSLTKVNSFLHQVGSYASSNLTFDQMGDIVKSYRTQIKQFKTIEIAGQGKRIGGIYYYIVNDATRLQVKQALVQQMKSNIDKKQ